MSVVPARVAPRGKACSRRASLKVMALFCSGWPNLPFVTFVHPEVSVGAGRSHHIRP